MIIQVNKKETTTTTTTTQMLITILLEKLHAEICQVMLRCILPNLPSP
jgi:hypothetical protein